MFDHLLGEHARRRSSQEISAPPMTSFSVRAPVACAKRALLRIHQLAPALLDNACKIRQPDVFARQAQSSIKSTQAKRRRPSPLTTIFTCAFSSRPPAIRLRHRRADNDRRSLLIIMEAPGFSCAGRSSRSTMSSDGP